MSTAEKKKSKKLIEVVDIKLDEADVTVFHPGDVITGSLIVSSLSAKVQRVCELSVRMHGMAGTSWTTGPVLMATPHMGHETYFEIVQFLHEEGGPKKIIDPGAMLEFPFSVTLPDDKVPCSYQSANGFVKYSIRGVLIPAPSGLQEKDEVEASYVDKEINLYAEYDVSTCPGVNDPVQITWSNDITNCCLALCKKNRHPFNLSLYIPKSGFAIAETINCDVEFTNNSTHKTPDVFINFIQKTTFIADDKTEKEGQARTLSIRKVSTVPPGKKVKEVVSFIVPTDCLPTRLGGCAIIRYEYFIEVEIEMDKKNQATIRRPVSIGSVNKSDQSNMSSNVIMIG